MQARLLKPQLPEFGPDGTPIEDELEFEIRLDQPAVKADDATDDSGNC